MTAIRTVKHFNFSSNCPLVLYWENNFHRTRNLCNLLIMDAFNGTQHFVLCREVVLFWRFPVRDSKHDPKCVFYFGGSTEP